MRDERGLVGKAAVTIMVLFHVHITSTFPLGVPLEWNLFFIYSILVLFGHYAGVGEGRRKRRARGRSGAGRRGEEVVWASVTTR